MNSLNLKAVQRKLQKVDVGFSTSKIRYCRSHWPRGLRRRSAAARLLRLWVRIPPGRGGMDVSVCCECFVLSGRGVLPTVVRRCV